MSCRAPRSIRFMGALLHVLNHTEQPIMHDAYHMPHPPRADHQLSSAGVLSLDRDSSDELVRTRRRCQRDDHSSRAVVILSHPFSLQCPQVSFFLATEGLPPPAEPAMTMGCGNPSLVTPPSRSHPCGARAIPVHTCICLMRDLPCLVCSRANLGYYRAQKHPQNTPTLSNQMTRCR